MVDKTFKIPKDEIKQLIQPIGGCFATDSITIEGNKILVMFKEEPSFENDSGWFFMSGLETQEYIDNPKNIMIYEVNTIANYDQSIIPFLNLPVGSRLERSSEADEFKLIED